MIPAYNAEKTIAAAITSVLKQTVPTFEIVVVDDGSTDRTADAVRALASDTRVRLLQIANSGPAAARNAGIDDAQGGLVGFLDSDDLWLPTYLETMVGAVESSRVPSLAYTDAWVLDDASGRILKATAMSGWRSVTKPPADPTALFRQLLKRNFVYTSTVVTREALTDVGGFDERLWIAEDHELWLRLANVGVSFHRAPGTLAVHRERAGSLTTDLRRLVAGRREVYEIVEKEYEITDDLRARARRERARLLRTLASIEAGSPSSGARGAAYTLRSLIRRATRYNPWFDSPPGDVGELLGSLAANGQD